MAKKKVNETAVVDAGAEPRQAKKAKAKAAGTATVDVCPRCNEPCHASEGTADGIHARCLTDQECAGANAAEPSPEPSRKRSKKSKASDITLEDLAGKYLAHLEEVGKSNGTLFSYKLELVTALDELGRGTKLADLTPTRVLEFFASDRVMKTRTGVAKAVPTFKKTRRVLRLALVWAQDAGLIEEAPLPEDAAAF
jgi:hypothetical protein